MGDQQPKAAPVSGAETDARSRAVGGPWAPIVVLAAAVVTVVVVYWQFGHLLKLNYLAERESQLREFQQSAPALVYGAAFLIYVLVTGLSLPGAAVMTLLMGWYFGFWRGVVLVSFASTSGATMAFLLSRFLLRDAIQQRFGKRLQSFNDALQREGAFYLFTVRLIPQVPFFVVNVVMALTPIRTWTFWWVSQLGMLAGTMVYVYAGSRVPDLQTLADQGVTAVISPGRLTQLTIAFVLLGLFPITVKKLLNWWRPRSPIAENPSS